MYFGMSSPIARPPNAIIFPASFAMGNMIAPAKMIVETSALVARKKPGNFQQLFGIFRFQMAQQRVAGRRRPSQAEARHCFAIQAAILKICRRHFAFVAFVQLPREKYRRLAVHLDQRARC